jgi:hypothetical protein
VGGRGLGVGSRARTRTGPSIDGLGAEVVNGMMIRWKGVACIVSNVATECEDNFDLGKVTGSADIEQEKVVVVKLDDNHWRQSYHERTHTSIHKDPFRGPVESRAQ